MSVQPANGHELQLGDDTDVQSDNDYHLPAEVEASTQTARIVNTETERRRPRRAAAVEADKRRQRQEYELGVDDYDRPNRW